MPDSVPAYLEPTWINWTWFEKIHHHTAGTASFDDRSNRRSQTLNTSGQIIRTARNCRSQENLYVFPQIHLKKTGLFATAARDNIRGPFSRILDWPIRAKKL